MGLHASALHNPHNTETTYDGRVYPSPAIQDRTAEAVAWLCTSPSVMGELVLTDDELTAMSAALKGSDAVEFTRLYQAAMDRHVQDELDDYKDRCGIRNESDYEAATALVRIHS
ncbi:hypothetical protein [Stenotrophomonas cyclobalanopsidis]|uniref:hypothetical protein n=1 Tax=Stenotrophomonas cyclobalanopsidis TaxID=2771362 RepID=UPI002FD91647